MNFDEINNVLKLRNTPDWGIINANASRVGEFINFLKQNQDLDKCIRLEFVELIIASMNEAILQQLDSTHTVNIFLDYIKSIASDDFYAISLVLLEIFRIK
ncbi:MAG: hypothetical protein HC912_06950 [Saprospiraceae bacterium]|nr:hypothetical protein [Saprospiraceae bacterium]